MTTILTIPHPILRQKAAAVEEFDGKLFRLVAEMEQTLESTDKTRRGVQGVGLAAPQIGASQRVILAKKVQGRSSEGPVIALINPTLTQTSVATALGWEGCLSVPDRYGEVERFRWVKVEAQNEKGKKRKFKAHGFFARILQHEIDHLEGILFTDKVVGRLYRGEELAKLSKETSSP